MLILISFSTFCDDEIPEIKMPRLGAILTDEGDLIIFPLGPMTLALFGYEYEIEINDVKIADFYTPPGKPNFFVRNILPPLLCTGASLTGLFISGDEEGWKYGVCGSIGLGFGIFISTMINRWYK